MKTTIDKEFFEKWKDKDVAMWCKKKEYAKDITYITNTELGFDYLRDNMAQRMEDKMQRGFHFCIIDEVDSVLIDEARTPLIVSGNSGKSTKLYVACNELAKQLEKGEVTELSNETFLLIKSTLIPLSHSLSKTLLVQE